MKLSWSFSSSLLMILSSILIGLCQESMMELKDKYFELEFLLNMNIEEAHSQVPRKFRIARDRLDYETETLDYCTQLGINRDTCRILLDVVGNNLKADIGSSSRGVSSTDVVSLFHFNIIEEFVNSLNGEEKKIAFIGHDTRIMDSDSRLNLLLSEISSSTSRNELDNIVIFRFGDSGENIDIRGLNINIIELGNTSHFFPSCWFLIRLFTQLWANHINVDMFSTDHQVLFLHSYPLVSNKIHPSISSYEEWAQYVINHYLDRYHPMIWNLFRSEYLDIIGNSLLSIPIRHFSDNIWWSSANFILLAPEKLIEDESSIDLSNEKTRILLLDPIFHQDMTAPPTYKYQHCISIWL